MADKEGGPASYVTMLFSPGGQERLFAGGRFRRVRVGHCLGHLLEAAFAYYQSRKERMDAADVMVQWQNKEGRGALPQPLAASRGKVWLLLPLLEVWLEALSPPLTRGKLRAMLGQDVSALDRKRQKAWAGVQTRRRLLEALQLALGEDSGANPWNAVESAWARCRVLPVPYRDTWWWGVNGEDALDVACAEMVLMLMHRVHLNHRPRVCPDCLRVYWAKKRGGKWDVACPFCSKSALSEDVKRFKNKLRQAKRSRSKRGPILDEQGYRLLLGVLRGRGPEDAEWLYGLVKECGMIGVKEWEAVLAVLDNYGTAEAEASYRRYARRRKKTADSE